MIPRILVPKNIRPAATDSALPAPSRLSTKLDVRTLIPANLPPVAIETKSSIPAHLPLSVLAERVVVPRDMPSGPLETSTSIPHHIALTILDSRIAVPKDLPPVVVEPKAPVATEELPDVLEPDVITTGEVHLLNKPVEERVSTWRWIARTSSIAFHFVLIILILLEPKLFPYRPPTPEEMELARRQLGFIYLPPSMRDVPYVAPAPSPPSRKMHIDPRVLRQIAPPNAEPRPLPGSPQPERVQPERSQRELPTAPVPQSSTPGDSQPRSEPPRQTARLESKSAENPTSGLTLPRTSPGRALEESMRDALKGRGGASTGGFEGPLPPSGGGGGQGSIGGNIQMLTPDEGVDFTNYLARVLASVKQNWYAVIPESARLGDKGKVVLQFKIMRDGRVPYPEPHLVDTSGKEPLDRAAVSSIRASNPFEPLPPAFSGAFIELRFIFLYNLPLTYQ